MKRSDISRYNRAVLFQTPLLRAINLSIAVFLVGALATVYWYAWRPLPQTSGELTAPVNAEASVARDGLGVPHITAGSWQDAMFLQGYVTAQDRMWQMDVMRRLAAGELSEIFGETTLDLDRQERRLRVGHIADVILNRMTPESRQILAAYAHGVNYFLETHRDKLPVEFALLKYEPRPWRVCDTVLLGLNQYRMLTTRWEEEIRKLRMMEKGDSRLVEFLFPRDTATTEAPGSNAWAISGTHTASGKPILASDPHLEFNVPSVWYMVHLKAPGLDVTGASLPGIPAVIIGHNERIAWGLTNLEYDMQDLFQEQINPRTGEYVYHGQLEHALIERDAIGVKDQAKPTEVVTLVTHDGPLFVTDEERSYALRWVATDVDTWDFPFLDLNRASNWDEFNAAMRRYPGPAQNVVYADVDGNIGYHVAGAVPVRPRGCLGDLPVVSQSGECDWQGVIPYDELPQAYNPDSGMIVSANQNPFPENYAYEVDGYFATTDRARQIRTRLGSQERWQAPQMLGIQKDVYSASLNAVARQVVEAWKKQPATNEQSRAAIEELRTWNGQMEIGKAAPMIATLVFEALRTAVAKRAAPGAEENYTGRLAVPVIARLLEERPRDWFEDYDELLTASLASAIDVGERMQGSNVARWDYGQYMRLEVQHPVLGRIPFVGRYFSIGPVPMSGSPTTVKQMTRQLGPSFRMVVDFSNLDASEANVLTGESGHALSSHFKDQWGAYYAGTSFPMQFGKVEAKETLKVRPE